MRYVFERFGVPYVLSIQCYDMRPSSKHLSCREADPLAVRFLNLLRTAGGTPAKIAATEIRPQPAGRKIGLHLLRPGRSDRKFGLEKNARPRRLSRLCAHEISDRRCARIREIAIFHAVGRLLPHRNRGRTGRKGAQYHCKVNGKPLVFDESAAENFTYPWRDNFCEMRDFLVGQCPGGYGHQGQDIRPGNCVLNNAEADRCQPYQHTVAAVQNGIIRRMAGDIGLYIVANTENERVRFRYLHMNPNFMDREGFLNGRPVSEGEIIGKVATWGDYEKGTSYHIHFNIQVFTKIGWVWVNPYMTLVAAYERLIGGRGIEILPGQPAPPVPDKQPVILHPEQPSEPSAAAPASPAKTEISVAERTKPQKRHHARKRRRHRHSGD